VSLLCELAGLPVEAPSAALKEARRDAGVLGERVRLAFEDWLAAEVAPRPVLIVLED
jgi:hypothetical protein